MNDALDTINKQVFVIRNILNNLDDLAKGMAILGMSSYKVENMAIELDNVVGKIEQASNDIVTHFYKTAEQSSANMINAALAGTKLNE